jgi:sugar phosphate isomerase/epimerase
MNPSRRQFLAASAAVVATGGLRPPLATAIDPIKRPSNKPDLKLSLAAYSMRQFLDLKKPTMTLFEFIDFAAELPLDAVELTSYYWAEKTDDYLEKLRAHAAKKKLTVSGVPVGNNFCVKDDAARKKQIQDVKDWTERAAKIGAKTVRIFAGNLEKGDTLEEAQKRVVAAMNECCEVAEKLGVALALENHGGITDTAEHLLDLVKPVKSKALGVNIDTGNFHTADPYADIAKIAPYGVVSQVKTEVFPNNKREDADLAKVIKILKDANFHGYVALEYEAKDDPKVEVPKFVKELRKLIG